MLKKSGSSPKSGSLKFLKIAIFLGGDSPERKISIKSGTAVKNALDSLGYNSELVDPASSDLSQITRSRFDAAFIALHGKGGEDGVLQAFLDRKKIPYTGSDARGCRLSFDKSKTKDLLKLSGIPTPDYITIDKEKEWRRKIENFKTPFFIKPLDDGSSLGVSCVENLKRAVPVIEKALGSYGRLLVERKITGREFTVAVFDGKALPVIELRPKRKFYDYKAKYTKGLCRYLIPAPIDNGIAKRMRNTALRVHEALRLRDVSRVDIMMDEAGSIYVLEANAIPGMTEMSLLPKAARESGVPFEELCETLIKRAVSRSVMKKPRLAAAAGV